MALQKILKKSYIDKIFEDVSNGVGVERFLEDTYPIDENYLLVTPQVNQPVDLLYQLDPTTDGDFKSAVAIFQAYKSLKPLQAINAQFWESLTLTDLFPYMQKRWNLKDSKNIQKSILNHFKIPKKGIIRHGLAGLWWLVYLTYDEDRDNQYELTEMIFKNYTLRFVRFGAGKIIQHKEAALGILQYLKDHEKELPGLENVANGLTSYFNKLGAVKQLSFLDRHFFYQEMETHIEEFKNAKTHHNDDNEDFDDDE